jgi:hypothetical protein
LIIIGIDTGTKTGYALNADGVLLKLSTLGIIDAQAHVLNWAVALKDESFEYFGHQLVICIEDTRQRKWVRQDVGRERLKGVGSVNRDGAIWEEFCEYHDIPYLLVPPAHLQGLTKMTEKDFRERTGWTGKRCSEHARDAGMMTWKYHRLITKGMVKIPKKPSDIKSAQLAQGKKGA